MSSEIRIDDQPCDLNGTPQLRPGFDAAALADPATAREGSSMELLLPRSPRNDRLLGDAYAPQGTRTFNLTTRRVDIEWKGALLFSGTARLLSCGPEGYRLELRDGAPQWARSAALGMLRTLPVSFRMQLTPVDICAGWSDSSAVKFFPVVRDDYPKQSSGTGLYPAERLLSVDD